MFIDGFAKTAGAYAQEAPETYFEHTHEKDPYVGAVLGGKGGALLGALKGKKGAKVKAALLGELVGSAGGALAGEGAKQVMRKYHGYQLRKYVKDLNLRSTPSRRSSKGEG